MEKKTAFLLAVATLIVGAACGGWGVSHYYGRFVDTWAVNSYAGDASTTLITLGQLRSGNDTNAIGLLEMKLDGDVVGLAAFLTDHPELRLDPINVKILKGARDYRVKFPRKTDSASDQVVARAYELVKGQP